MVSLLDACTFAWLEIFLLQCVKYTPFHGFERLLLLCLMVTYAFVWLLICCCIFEVSYILGRDMSFAESVIF